MSNKTVHKIIAEVIGTFSLVFAGCGSVVVSQYYGQALPSFLVPIIFGLVVFTMVHSIGHLSGAHLNPAVTLALAFSSKFPKSLIFPYWLGQIAGAFAAIGLLSFLFPDAKSLGSTIPSVPVFKALVWEFI